MEHFFQWKGQSMYKKKKKKNSAKSYENTKVTQGTKNT